MRHDLFVKLGMLVIAALLLLNLAVTIRARAATSADSERSEPIQYQVIRVGSSTNQDLIFKDAGSKGLELAGTIEIAGNTGYLVFKKK